MKIKRNELPPDVKERYKDMKKSQIHKILYKKTTNTIIVYLRPVGREIWKKFLKKWTVVFTTENVDKSLPVFSIVPDTPRIL